MKKCCMCYEIKGVYSLGELSDGEDNTDYIINQAKLILALGGEREDNYCEECFWK